MGMFAGTSSATPKSSGGVSAASSYRKVTPTTTTTGGAFDGKLMDRNVQASKTHQATIQEETPAENTISVLEESVGSSTSVELAEPDPTSFYR